MREALAKWGTMESITTKVIGAVLVAILGFLGSFFYSDFPTIKQRVSINSEKITNSKEDIKEIKDDLKTIHQEQRAIISGQQEIKRILTRRNR